MGVLVVTWLPWSISPTAVAKGPLAPIKLLPAWSPPSDTASPEAGAERRGGGGAVAARRFHTEEVVMGSMVPRHTPAVTCSRLPHQTPGPGGASRTPAQAGTYELSAEPSFELHVAQGKRACVHVCVTRSRGCNPGGRACLGVRPPGCGACLLAARGSGGHCMGGVCPGFLSCNCYLLWHAADHRLLCLSSSSQERVVIIWMEGGF